MHTYSRVTHLQRHPSRCRSACIAALQPCGKGRKMSHAETLWILWGQIIPIFTHSKRAESSLCRKKRSASTISVENTNLELQTFKTLIQTFSNLYKMGCIIILLILQMEGWSWARQKLEAETSKLGNFTTPIQDTLHTRFPRRKCLPVLPRLTPNPEQCVIKWAGSYLVEEGI